MQFSPSPRGHHLLAYNSSRIYVVDLRGPGLAVKRELKILRRPVSTCIVDDGTFLAVLSTDMQVDLYDLNQTPPHRKQSLILDNTPRAIALSPCGQVLAAAYEGGIEVSSLNPGALPTERRAVKCDGVDALAFSLDGTQLLGTTTTSTTPNTVILTAPYYDPGGQLANDDISALWTTSILFPNTSRDCSHAVLLQESSSLEAMWTFTYDRSFETFRAVRIDDLRNGTTYFTGPVPAAASLVPLLPSTLPAANYQGDLVSAGFHGKHIWLYGVPEDLEAIPEAHHPVESSTSPSLHRQSSGHSVSSTRMQEANGHRVPQWQILCDKLRNTFVNGRMIAESGGVSNVKWVSGFGESSLQERLIIASKGIVPHRQITEEEGIDFVDGGRITLLDFDYGLENGQGEEIIIEVGTMEPEILEEEHRDIDTEVAIARRRTVAQRRGNRSRMMRAATTTNRQTEALLRRSTAEEDMEDPLIPRRMMTARDGSRSSVSDPLDDVSLEEAQEALDAPYTHASPRSGTTLRRAATAAAVNRERNPAPPTAGIVQYRRADGRAEHPHESDADNWVPPPPPYSKEDPVVDLPSFLRHTPISGLSVTARNSRAPSDIPPVPPLPSVLPVSRVLPTGITSITNRLDLPRIRTSALKERSRQASESSIVSQQSTRDMMQGTEGRTAVGPSAFAQGQQPHHEDADAEDIYGASPIRTPSPGGLASEAQSILAGTPEREPPFTNGESLPTQYTPVSSRVIPPGEGVGLDSIRSYEPVSGILFSSSMSGPMPQDELTGSGGFDAVPPVRRLQNTSTWPRAPGTLSVVPAPTLAGYPRSAPATNTKNDELIAASLPPASGPQETMDSHNRRDDSSAPKSASGNIQISRIAAGGHHNHDYASRRFSVLPQQRPPSPPEQPLIISTPTGVAGAFDVSQPSTASHSRGPVLHAPVPRHPRPTPGDPLNRPTAERLETLTVSGSRTEARANLETLGSPPPSSQFFMRHHTSVHRRPSRARRGALKNLQDARERGWTGRKGKKKNAKEPEVATGTGWTDVSIPPDRPPGHTKEKRCTMM